MKRLALAITALSLMLAACETTGAGKARSVVAKPPTASAGLSPRERERRAIEMLNQGRPDEARAELQAALAKEPDAPLARKLLDQIEKDPQTLLGTKSFAYRMKRGETFSGLAGRFLGDPNLFYALARYNGVAVPAQGQLGGDTIRIPGVPKKAAAPAPRKPASAAKAPPPSAAAAKPPSAAPARDPGRANQLRAEGLQQMNRGAIDSAVALLRQAQRLDPESALIRRDLNRALRIQATVRANS